MTTIQHNRQIFINLIKQNFSSNDIIIRYVSSGMRTASEMMTSIEKGAEEGKMFCVDILRLACFFARNGASEETQKQYPEEEMLDDHLILQALQKEGIFMDLRSSEGKAHKQRLMNIIESLIKNSK